MMTIKKLKELIKEQSAIARQTISRLHAEAQTCRKQFNTTRNNSIHLTEKLMVEERKLLENQIQGNQNELHSLINKHPSILQDTWEAIASNHPQKAIPNPIINIGTLNETRTNLTIPLFAPFIGQNTTILINGQNEKTQIDFLNALLLRIALQLSDQYRFSLLDSYSQGRAFTLAKEFETNSRPLGNDLGKNLDTLQNEISRIIRQYTDSQCDSFEKLPTQFHLSEPFEFIAVAHFPRDFRDSDIDKLKRIARNGPTAGKYLIIQTSEALLASRQVDWNEFGPIHHINLDDTSYSISGFTKYYNTLPPEGMLARILQNLNSHKKTNPQLPFDQHVAQCSGHWWKDSSNKSIQTPIGVHGVKEPLNIYFGENEEGTPCAHGIWAGMTGSGKSNSYHVLICGLAQRYSPQELQFYLIDGKDGVEFQDYRQLPHAKAVVLHSLPELSCSILKELVEEKERRNELFTKAGVSNLRDYKANGQPLGELPRILLMVDEYQELFTEETQNDASLFLRELAQQGRSAGIHMLLGSQSFQVDNMKYKSSILGNCHLRMAMKMAPEKIGECLEFGKKGKSLIEHCNVPGKIVANSESGDDTKNILGQVAILKDEQRREIIKQLAAKASRMTLKTLVIDGSSQPSFAQTPFVESLSNSKLPITTERYGQVARLPQHQSGLGRNDWDSGETNFLLGQQFNVHGYTNLTLRRRNLENILLIGENQSAHYGMIIGIMQSLLLSHHKNQSRFILMDFSQAGTDWNSTLQKSIQKAKTLGLAVQHITNPDLGETTINRLSNRMRNLQGQALLNGPTLLCISEAEQWSALHKQSDKFDIQKDSPLGTQLRKLYTTGPLNGIHVMMSFGLVTPMFTVLDRKSLSFFRHQILMQVGEDDSISVLQNRRASQLQCHGTSPIAALYCDRIGGKESRFKPYSCDPASSFHQTLKPSTERYHHEHG